MNNTRRTNININNINNNSKKKISYNKLKYIKLKNEYKFYKTLQNAIYTEYPYYSYILWPNGIPKMYYSIIRVLIKYKNSTMYGFIAKEINNFIDKIIASPNHNSESSITNNQSNKNGVYKGKKMYINLYNELANAANNVRIIEKEHNKENINTLKIYVKPKNGYDVLIDMFMLCYNIHLKETVDITNILYIFDFDMNIFNKNSKNVEIKEIEEIEKRIISYNKSKNVDDLKIKANINEILKSPSGIYYALNIFFNDRKEANDKLNKIIKEIGDEANDISKIFLLHKTALITTESVKSVNEAQHFSECFKINYNNAIKLMLTTTTKENNDPYHIYENLNESYFTNC
uniref:Uncharacterized protein n=1 Tax=viral metagenome TaxID=1070528 RepID=A0A6C0EVM4_9ZZZZ